VMQGAGDAVVGVGWVHGHGGKGRLRDYRRPGADGADRFPV